MANRHAAGPFDVQMSPWQAPHEEAGGPIGRFSIAKKYRGDLEGEARGEMLAASTDVAGSAGYVAIERVSGILEGRSGGFTLQHAGTLDRGAPTLVITVVPDSGSGELAGLAGRMAITVADGKHTYDFEYTLPGDPGRGPSET